MSRADKAIGEVNVLLRAQSGRFADDEISTVQSILMAVVVEKSNAQVGEVCSKGENQSQHARSPF